MVSCGRSSRCAIDPNAPTRLPGCFERARDILLRWRWRLHGCVCQCVERATKKELLCAATNVSFVGEEGVDEGGLSREMWAQLRLQLCSRGGSSAAEAAVGGGEAAEAPPKLFEPAWADESGGWIPSTQAAQADCESLGKLLVKVVVESQSLPPQLAAYVLAYICCADEGHAAADKAALGTEGNPDEEHAEEEAEKVLCVVEQLDPARGRTVRNLLDQDSAGFATQDDLFCDGVPTPMPNTRPGRAAALVRHHHRHLIALRRPQLEAMREGFAWCARSRQPDCADWSLSSVLVANLQLRRVAGLAGPCRAADLRPALQLFSPCSLHDLLCPVRFVDGGSLARSLTFQGFGARICRVGVGIGISIFVWAAALPSMIVCVRDNIHWRALGAVCDASRDVAPPHADKRSATPQILRAIIGR